MISRILTAVLITFCFGLSVALGCAGAPASTYEWSTNPGGVKVQTQTPEDLKVKYYKEEAVKLQEALENYDFNGKTLKANLTWEALRGKWQPTLNKIINDWQRQQPFTRTCFQTATLINNLNILNRHMKTIEPTFDTVTELHPLKMMNFAWELARLNKTETKFLQGLGAVCAPSCPNELMIDPSGAYPAKRYEPCIPVDYLGLIGRNVYSFKPAAPWEPQAYWHYFAQFAKEEYRAYRERHPHNAPMAGVAGAAPSTPSESALPHLKIAAEILSHQLIDTLAFIGHKSASYVFLPPMQSARPSIEARAAKLSAWSVSFQNKAVMRTKIFLHKITRGRVFTTPKRRSS